MNRTPLLMALMLLFAASGFAIFYNHQHPLPKLAVQAEQFPGPDTIVPPPARTFPALLVKRSENDSASVPLQLKTLKMEVKALGNLAQTTMEMTFYNDLDRDLEGQFFFPLGEGQSVSGYALEVEGVMRKGVVVEKAQGRKVFESVTRRKIDPGLLEWTRGNNFKTRIFPIPAKGTKRISVTVDQELLSAVNAYQYVMPMQFREKIENFSLKVEVIKQNVEPAFEEAPGNIRFKNWKDSWTADFDTTRFMADQPLRFQIPKLAEMKKLFVQDAEQKNQSYFYYAFDPVKQDRPKKLPTNVCLLWDASGSGMGRNVRKELEILEQYFGKIGNLKVQVVTFNNTVSQKKEFVIASGQTDELKNYLWNMPFDGGTQLGAIDLKKYSCDEFILCSDGISSFGLSDLKTADRPIMAISSSQQADHSVLNMLARQTGGQYLNALNLSTTEATRLLTTDPFRFLGATITSGKIAEVAPSLPTDVNNTFSISGIMEGAQAEMELSFGYGHEKTFSQKIVITKENMVSNDMVEHAWSQKKIAELDLAPEKNRVAITAIAKDHGIVTKYTSLLVLDRIEDYVTHRIVPPEEKLRKEYYAQLEKKMSEEKETAAQSFLRKKEHLEKVVTAFNERVNWWNTDFKPETLKKLVKEQLNKSSGDTEVAAEEMAMTDSTAAYIPNGSFSHDLNPGYNYTTVNNNATAKTAEQQSMSAEIDIKEFDPDMPYLKALKSTAPEAYYTVYLEQRKKYAISPTFYLDVSDFFFKKGLTEKGITILSNLAELYPENHQVLRVMAHRLQQAKLLELAIITFQEVLKIREEEPQSYRDLGLVYAEAKKYQEAVDVLCKVVNREWDARFPEVEVIAAGEINAVLAQSGQKLKLDSLDKRLVKSMPVDVRVVINWDNDNCDMDLWVTDPLDEVCMYNHNRTRAGGAISKDFTGGYGPEEFMVKKAINGKYLVQVNYYGNSQLTITGPTTVQAELYTNYGRANQARKNITLRLEENKQVIDIGELVFASK